MFSVWVSKIRLKKMRKDRQRKEAVLYESSGVWGWAKIKKPNLRLSKIKYFPLDASRSLKRPFQWNYMAISSFHWNFQQIGFERPLIFQLASAPALFCEFLSSERERVRFAPQHEWERIRDGLLQWRRSPQSAEFPASSIELALSPRRHLPESATAEKSLGGEIFRAEEYQTCLWRRISIFHFGCKWPDTLMSAGGRRMRRP